MKRSNNILAGFNMPSQAGVTLIEIVIVMGILALAIIPIYNNIFGTRIQVSKANLLTSQCTCVAKKLKK